MGSFARFLEVRKSGFRVKLLTDDKFIQKNIRKKSVTTANTVFQVAEKPRY